MMMILVVNDDGFDDYRKDNYDHSDDDDDDNVGDVMIIITIGEHKVNWPFAFILDAIELYFVNYKCCLSKIK